MNTCFLPKMTNSHKKRNNIDRIRIGGDWLNGEDEVRTGIANAFKELLSDLGVWRCSLEGLNFSRLDERDAARLEVPFIEEVHFALDDLNRASPRAGCVYCCFLAI